MSVSVVKKEADRHSKSSGRRALNKYYKHLFPGDDLYRWFCYGDVATFRKREFAFSLHEYDVFVRNTMFFNVQKLKEYLARHIPKKIDTGAYYNIALKAKNRSNSSSKPVEKELIFDIDLSDYDDVRTCCREKQMCQKCWKFVAVGCKILDDFLREDFGWKLILWVYSGRRGIHCWVCDESARKLKDTQRRQFADLLNPRIGINGIYSQTIQFHEKRLSNHLRRSFAIAKDPFLDFCVQEQNILGTEKGIEHFLLHLPPDCREEAKKIILKNPTSKGRWINFHLHWYYQIMMLKSKKWMKRPHLIEEIILSYLYPRIDANVTKGLKHLLKIPFVFHPDTRILSIPFDPNKVDEFDVDKVPKLLHFVNAFVSTFPGNHDKHALFQIKTFEESMKIFKDFVNKVEEASTVR